MRKFLILILIMSIVVPVFAREPDVTPWWQLIFMLGVFSGFIPIVGIAVVLMLVFAIINAIVSAIKGNINYTKEKKLAREIEEGTEKEIEAFNVKRFYRKGQF